MTVVLYVRGKPTKSRLQLSQTQTPTKDVFKRKTGAEEMAQHPVQMTKALSENWVPFPEPKGQLPTICNSNSNGSKTFSAIQT